MQIDFQKETSDWKKQELQNIFPGESGERIERALQEGDLTSAINYLLDNNEDDVDIGMIITTQVINA